MRHLVLSLGLVACGFWSIEASAQLLWQIGTFDGPPSNDSNLEFQNNAAFFLEFDYNVDTDPDDEIAAPATPGILSDAPIPPGDNPAMIDAADIFHIRFELTENHENVMFRIDRSGDEDNEVLLDGEPVQTILGPGELTLATFMVDLGTVDAGQHILTLVYAGGGIDNGFNIDAMSLSGTPVVSEGEGEGEGEGRGRRNRCMFRTMINDEWPFLAAELGLTANRSPNSRGRIPPRWGLSMVSAVMCNTRHPHHMATLASFEANLDLLSMEAQEILDVIGPFQNVLAAGLMLGENQSKNFVSHFMLQGDYEAVLPRGKGPEATELYSDKGDLDKDGYTNETEYLHVVSSGGQRSTFERFSTNDSLNVQAIPAMNWEGLALMFVVVASAGLFASSRKNARARAAIRPENSRKR